MRVIVISVIWGVTMMVASAQVQTPVIEPLASDPSISLVGKEARVVAVNDALEQLAVGASAGRVQIFALQSDGTPSAQPVQEIQLPYPASLQSVATPPLSLLFHPQFPLLYVWQELNIPFSSPHDKGKDLKRLSIFRHDGSKWEWVGSFASGEGFAYGQSLGSLALTQDRKHLVLPNVFRSGNTGLALLSLDEKGLPGASESADPRPLFFSGNPPMGAGILTEKEGLILAGCSGGIYSVDLAARVQVIHAMGSHGSFVAGAHGTQPIFYFASAGGQLVAFEHVDGYLSQMPRVFQFPDGTNFSAPPVVLIAKQWLALSGNNSLLLVELDDRGWPRPKARRLTTPGRPAQLAYSEKFKRLYVPIP